MVVSLNHWSLTCCGLSKHATTNKSLNVLCCAIVLTALISFTFAQQTTDNLELVRMTMTWQWWWWWWWWWL